MPDAVRNLFLVIFWSGFIAGCAACWAVARMFLRLVRKSSGKVLTLPDK
jgi:hypothetical protein